MKLLIVLLLVAVALVSCTPQKKSKYSTHPRHKEFCDWKTKHGKNAQYRDGSLEHDQRFLNYLTNSAKADQRNLAGGAKHGPNSLSDLTHTEFEKRNGFKQSPPSHKRSLSQWGGRQVLATPSVSLTAIDWSSSGASTPIKDQGQCGSCWAHAATETTEKYLKLTTGSSTELSQQQVIDCDTDGSGCNGGPSDLNWVQTYGGLTSSANYPPTSYQTDNQGTCQTGMQVLGQIPGWGAVDSTDESVIAQHLLCYGPLLVMVDATQWQTYTGGIMTASQCAFSSYDHAVVLTGVDPVNNYWIIQNSWGTGWGENGYIRLAYGTQTCGIQGTGANDVFLSAPTASLSTAQCLSGSSASPPSVTPPPPPSVTPPPPPPPPSVTPPPPPPSVTPTPPSPSGACTDLFMGTPCDCQDSFCNDGSGDPCCCDGEQCDWVVSSSSSSSGTDSSDSSDSSGSFSSGGWDNWAQASNTQTYNSSSSQDAGLSVSQIVGIVIGSALIALIVGFVIGLVLTKKSTAERV